MSTVARSETEKRSGVLERFSINASHSRTTKRTDGNGVNTLSLISKVRGSSYASGALRALAFIVRGTLLLELKIHIYCYKDLGKVLLFKPNARMEV